LGQQGLIGPVPFALICFFVLFGLLYILLERSGFGRKTYVIGSNRDVADFAGIDTARHKMIIFTMSSTAAAFAGLLYAARTGSVRGDVAAGFELDVITIVLLGGVSIFGGKGTLIGTLLSILIVLNLRNGMGLLSITGHIQTGVIGLLLIASVVIPRLKFATPFKPQREASQ
jgi:rhamnose transport system permease protein